jgi:methylthioribulose-1-phosphate dehydratase
MNTTTNHQLNPYAIQLCTLSRWISAKQWAPAGSGNFSIRSGEHSCLITRAHKDKGELSPHDLVQISWRCGEAELATEAADSALLHVALYQQFPAAKVVLQCQSVNANVWSRLIKASNFLFSGYELQSAITPQPAQQHNCSLAILDANQPIPLQAAEIKRRTDELASGLLVRGHGLYVWADSLEQAKRQLEAWEFLISCELERLKVTGLL